MIYISLTTVPVRMSFWEELKKNLNTLLNQNTISDYKVILNIPYRYRNNNDEEYIISDELTQFANENPKLILNRVEEDLGPITKIVGSFSICNDPNDVLIVCDDDHLYHEDMVEYHLKKMNEYPKCVIAFRGDSPIEKREWEEDGIKKYTLPSTHFYFPVKNDSQLVIPGHWHSVGYKRSFFKDDFLDKDFLSSSDNDDVLVGYYLKKYEIHIRCVAWDKETDFRAVNDHGRGAHTFPIIYPLPYPNSGFYEFRQKAGHHMGRTEDYIWELIHNHDKIYTENE
jgi:hypothetical protein